MNVGLQFEYKKATQALNFFALQNGGEIEKLHALKLIFFADRYHLRKYGRPITNDQYWAMPLGPVPSAVKDLFELDSASSPERHYAEQFFRPGSRRHSIQSCLAMDLHVCSETDIEALSFAWKTFGSKSGIVEKTHDYPEWKRHETALKAGCSRVPMDYMDFLDDPAPGVNTCHELTEQERLDRRAQLHELTIASSLWR